MSIIKLCQRTQIIDNEIRIFRSDIQQINHESRGQRERIRENIEKVKMNKQPPYLVGNVVEVLEPNAEDGLDNDDEEDGGATDFNAEQKNRSAVIRTLTRQTIYLPVPGLVDTNELKPSDLVGTNKDSSTAHPVRARRCWLGRAPTKPKLSLLSSPVPNLSKCSLGMVPSSSEMHSNLPRKRMPMGHTAVQLYSSTNSMPLGLSGLVGIIVLIGRSNELCWNY